ncbi:hypothetical protein [Streptomyces sp. NBC_01508]|uniref:hypothetical protein n=1 Tax=Streptomyces sp. NBC_01508 TaxID=2903888 RepID=UPI00386BD30E
MRLRCTSTVGRLGRALATLIAVTALTWAFAPSAVAGGPTSVLIASPDSAETASFYFSDGEYEALSTELGSEGMGGLPKGQKKPPPSVESAMGSRQINVTWMAHDVDPWRLDRVYPSADASTVWIYTSTDRSGLDTGVWHKAYDPAALRALLKKFGVMGERDGSAAGAADTPAKDQQRAAAAGASSGGTDGWWWAIPALGAGVVLGLVLRPLAGRLPRPPFGRGGNRPEAGPRRQLLEM